MSFSPRVVILKRKMLRKCKLTGEEFYPKRSNMVFKTAEARIKYHNNIANKLRKEKEFVDRPLFINKVILDNLLLNQKKKKIHKEYLLGKGFNFSVHTHIEKYQGKRYYAVYNYLIITLDNNRMNIVKYA